MAKGTYNGGSTIIRTGNSKMPVKQDVQTKYAKRNRKIKGYVLHKKGTDMVLSVTHGEALVGNGSCREIGTWEGYISIEYKK